MVKGFGFKTQTISIKEREVYRHFLDKILQITEQGLQKGQLVYSLLETNLEKLNDVFAEVLRPSCSSFTSLYSTIFS
ncbi:hypothetical protein [uncultured Nostoc sp.]|uniref:hypothetical protein n=1 Tax=uncultured Nostoc sp. TaxID=340711 RepID=UPI0035CA54DC